MEDQPVSGTLTSYASLFPAEEAKKASKRVLDTVAERQKELQQLCHFIADNASLINVVQRLPDELHHQIMVPFGKAAFFPGQLIHTNEFLVLLGEGYYAKRTSKQTIEILKRRGKQLGSQVESIKALMEDLKAEATFFDTTAAEVGEDLVEIREDYVDETSNENLPLEGVDSEKAEVMDEDQEFARIMSRIEELEKEEENEKYMEEETEKGNKHDEDELNDAVLGHSMSQLSVDHEVKSLEAHHASKSQVQLKPDTLTEKEPSQKNFQQAFSNQLEGPMVHPVSKDGSLHERSPTSNKSSLSEKALTIPKEENEQAVPRTRTEAFTGSIVENTHSLEMNPREQTAPSTSKPVSRFKMQRK